MATSPQHYLLVAPVAPSGRSEGLFTYASSEPLVAGQIVAVPFGRQQSLGIVVGDTKRPPFATKPVSAVLDLPPLPSHLLELAQWLVDYYATTPGSVWHSFLPAGLTRKRRAVQAESSASAPQPLPPLSAEQVAALVRIQAETTHPILLQGVTGSGKTRLYLELALETLATGRDVIILVPEIALTPQIVGWFREQLGETVIANHSKQTERERHESWTTALSADTPKVIIGPRSSLFLPVRNPGLIIVDECHESSYKQESAPRYHALAVAGKLASLTQARLVFGSATPGLWETYLAEHGRLTRVSLTSRINGQPLPHAHIIDLSDKSLRRRSQFITEPLLQGLEKTLAERRQSLLFLNRRGSATSQMCPDCGYVSLCPNCGLPATFHADHLKLICHICNWRGVPPATCPQCHGINLRYLGGGTKRIEAEIAKLLPTARIARLDRDSATPKYLHQTLADIAGGEIDILIGTQMIAKGLDLPAIDTVGVISADTMLHLPDFSASERTFQLLTQVAGRAGRGGRPGEVFIQTLSPEHPAIVAASTHDYSRFATAELENRRLLGYPPYRYLLKCSVALASAARAQKAAQTLFDTWRSVPGVQLLGPAPAFREQAHDKYHWQLVVRSADRSRLVGLARELPNGWTADLDPLNLL